MELRTYECPLCKEQFVYACLSQLQEKLKMHCCKSRSTNKKRERSKQFKRDQIALYIEDMITNSVEHCNFDRLVRRGMVADGQKEAIAL